MAGVGEVSHFNRSTLKARRSIADSFHEGIPADLHHGKLLPAASMVLRSLRPPSDNTRPLALRCPRLLSRNAQALHQILLPMTHQDRFLAYLQAYESRDIARVADMLADDVSLRDWKISVSGKAAAVAETQANFDASRSIEIHPLRLHVGEASVAGELRILVDDNIELFVVDVLDFDAQGKIRAIRAFLGRGDA